VLDEPRGMDEAKVRITAKLAKLPRKGLGMIIDHDMHLMMRLCIVTRTGCRVNDCEGRRGGRAMPRGKLLAPALKSERIAH